MKLSIRKYKKGDFIYIATLANDEWKQDVMHFATLLHKYDETNSIERCYVAEMANEIVGFIYGYSLPNKTLIPLFTYVNPQHRKAGIATQLLKTLEGESGCSSSLIFYNRSLHDYYARQGYETDNNLETAIKNLNQDGGKIL